MLSQKLRVRFVLVFDGCCSGACSGANTDTLCREQTKQTQRAREDSPERVPPPPPVANALDRCGKKQKKRMFDAANGSAEQLQGKPQHDDTSTPLFLDRKITNISELEIAAKREGYWLEHMRSAMLACMLEPLFQFKSFRVEKDYWYESFISDQAYRLMSSDKKDNYKNALKQSNVIELLGACGYVGEHGQQVGATYKYKQFNWNGAFAAKTAYRFASTKGPRVDKKNGYIFNGRKQYNKIRCPNLLKTYLEKLCPEHLMDPEQSKFKFIERRDMPDFAFLRDMDLESRLVDNRFFFPFQNLEYDVEMVPNLFKMTDVDSDLFSYDTSPELCLTAVSKRNIQLVYRWLVKAYLTNKLQIGIHEN
jgi:hypothetical protein